MNVFFAQSTIIENTYDTRNADMIIFWRFYCFVVTSELILHSIFFFFLFRR